MVKQKKSAKAKQETSSERERKFKNLMRECQRRINEKKGSEVNDSQIEMILAAATLVCLRKNGHALPDDIEELIDLKRSVPLPTLITYAQSSSISPKTLSHAARGEKPGMKN
jgi:hypothetical protein